MSDNINTFHRFITSQVVEVEAHGTIILGETMTTTDPGIMATVVLVEAVMAVAIATEVDVMYTKCQGKECTYLFLNIF